MQVISPYGNMLHQEENATTGSFAFTTTESGSYQACFWVENHHKNIEATLNLEWRIGITAKDWDTIAKKENIEVSFKLVYDTVAILLTKIFQYC